MKKLYFLAFISCIGIQAFAQSSVNGLPKLSPLTRLLLKDIDKTGSVPDLPDGYIYKQANGTKYLTGLIKVADAAAVEQKISKLGVITGTKAGDIWTVQVPFQNVRPFTETKGISYIQLDEPLRPELNVARKTTRADSVHMGVGLPWAFTGRDVVMGIIDFGFDYNHPMLYDSNGTNFRIKKVWELNTTGTPPAGYTYGHELTTPTSIIAQGTDNTIQTHGTGVAGIAAGSGYGTSKLKLRGIAPEADMVFVGVRRDSIASQWMQSSFSDFVDGINYIFSYGTSIHRPAVVNISWGSQSGPHDGTSLFNQACDNLSGEGKIIVMSAGNEGEEKLHLSKTFSLTDTLINTFATFSSPAYQRTWVDIWGDTSKTFCAKVTLYKNGVAGNTTGFFCIDDQVHSTYILGANGLDTCFVDFITSSSEFNDKPRITVNIWNKAVDSIKVSVKGTDGSIDMWDEYYYYGYTHSYSSIFESLGQPDAVDGNTISTVSDMGSAKSVLLVGAYASKVNFTDINNNQWSYQSYVAAGNLVPFSSRGPMIDGRIKPDITAPGLTLATSISSFDTRYTPTGLNSTQVVSSFVFNGKTYYYAEFSGTSASSPVASGIVALMLQGYPRMKPQEAQDIIAQTALKDNFTGAIPAQGNNNWGKGKINAFAAAKAAWQANGVYEFRGAKLDCVLFPNPGNGVFTIGYSGSKTENLDISVYDIKGSIVFNSNWIVSQGDNTYSADLSRLPKGSYLVRLSSAQGNANIKAVIQ